LLGNGPIEISEEDEFGIGFEGRSRGMGRHFWSVDSLV
jgi:hypothetical protein